MDLENTPAAHPLSATYVRDRVWLQAHLDALAAEHPDHWVAVVNGRVVAIAPDAAEARRRAEAEHPAAEPVVWLLEGGIHVY